MFSRDRDEDPKPHAIRVIRDIVEVVAIVAAGFWAFYVFIYENRIKPFFTNPQPTFTATMQETSRRNGAIGILLKTDLRNQGSVPFYFVGYAVSVIGARLTLSTHPLPGSQSVKSDALDAYFRFSRPAAVYSYGYVTALGNPSSQTGGQLEPGGSYSQEHTFFVPDGRFDVLTARIDACFAQSQDHVMPARLIYHADGVAVVRCDEMHFAYDVGSLDLRK